MSRLNAFGQTIDASGRPTILAQVAAPQAPQGPPAMSYGHGNSNSDWDGYTRFLGAAGQAAMPLGMSQLLGGVQGFGNAMHGAMGQLGGLQQQNASNTAQARQLADQMQMTREGRHDANQRFTMLYDALLKPKATPAYDRYGQLTEVTQSP